MESETVTQHSTGVVFTFLVVCDHLSSLFGKANYIKERWEWAGGTAVAALGVLCATPLGSAYRGFVHFIMLYFLSFSCFLQPSINYL